jgi:O-methyltransferase involved in polyketide biosynthesis
MGFERISLTARLAAWMRQFSDIPFAAEVARRLHARETFEALLREHDMEPEDLLWYAPVFEGRYRAVERAIRESGAAEVLELASGLSLRGLAMTADPTLTYVESDLPELTEEKAALVAELRRDMALPDHGNLHLAAADALDLAQLRAAAAPLRPGQPAAIVSEGLLPYLLPDEVKTLAGNVRELLAELGGVWITPDFALTSDVGDVSERQRRFRAVIAAATERRMHTSTFADEGEVHAFLRGLGLRATVRRVADEPLHLVSPERLGLSRETVEAVVRRLRVWIVTLDAGAR